MKNILVIVALLTGLTSLTQAASTTLADTINPQTYLARKTPVLNIALFDYGREHTPAKLVEIKKLLEDRFYLATNKMLKLNVSLTKSLPYKFQIKNYPNYKNGNITDKQRLQRLWYYDFVNAKILTEAYGEFVKSESRTVLGKLDAIATISGAQFDGMGYAYGRMAITESPREIAWGLAGGGYVEVVSKGHIVDELIHEIGHTIFLDHAVTQCQDPKLNYLQKQACCAASPNKNDVMSYCRDRSAVNDTDKYFGFQACNLRNLKNKIIPAMLKGQAWKVTGREICN